ncbi:MAG: hypothetical protein WA876_07450 [Candidatus Acidiferrales bacterium]
MLNLIKKWADPVGAVTSAFVVGKAVAKCPDSSRWWIVVGYLVLLASFGWLWWKEHRMSGVLAGRCDRLISDWVTEGRKFVNIYQKPIDFPMSFDMQNYDKTAFRVGRLQLASEVIFDAAVKINKNLESLDDAPTVEDLTRRLIKCRYAIKPPFLS